MRMVTTSNTGPLPNTTRWRLQDELLPSTTSLTLFGSGTFASLPIGGSASLLFMRPTCQISLSQPQKQQRTYRTNSPRTINRMNQRENNNFSLTDKIDNAVLAMRALTVHDENKFGARAWKGYDWDSLGRLHDKRIIHGPVGKAKSVALVSDGLAKCCKLFDNYVFARVTNRVTGASSPTSNGQRPTLRSHSTYST